MTELPPQLKRTRSGNMKDLPPKPTYRSIKTSLKSVVKNNLVMEKLTDAALRANSIMIHALQLLKLYLLHSCDVGDKLPTLDPRFVSSAMKMLCKTPSSDRPSSVEAQIIKDALKDFYEQHYKLQSLRGEKERGEQASEPSVQRVHLPKAEAGGYMRRQITEARLLKRSRHDRRDRGLDPEAASQVLGAHQGQGL